ncbi:MAG: class I SAM-dependent methyltransferase [Bacteroidia bacterium]
MSWYEPTPATSLKLIEESQIKKDAKIIDVGGGDSFLVDHLLEKGYSNITVLDISASALERAKQRLGEKAGKVKWIVADAADFIPAEKYDLWHDRAAFHFLTKENEISNYVRTITENVNPDGTVIIGTFSDKGPKKCSGIEIKQYSEQSLPEKFKEGFEKVTCNNVQHTTPFNTVQDFIFCVFKRKN